jgi:hypothetical protein
MLERDSPECLAALDGTVDIGGACDLDEDCKGKALCKASSGTCPGQCTALLVAGQACAQDSNCQDGLQCSTETKLCVLPAGNGQPCEYGAPPCGPGFLCLGKDDTNKKSGTCSSAAQAFSGVAGGACDPTLGQLCSSRSLLRGRQLFSCGHEHDQLAMSGDRQLCCRRHMQAGASRCLHGWELLQDRQHRAGGAFRDVYRHA